MFIYNDCHRFLPISVLIFLVLNGYCFCMSKSFNISLDSNFLPTVATWYGPPEGSGSGGACGLENDVANSPYNGLISAGNNNLFKSGVKCIQNPACSRYPITVTVIDKCPGTCNNDPVHFNLSGKAFGVTPKDFLNVQFFKFANFGNSKRI
ncbi:hypothetical protein CDL12_20556 [Handroanthus impetiginosus]|uniref:Expansin-like EG45 domain-containing protein n=1 Tax=Handroanthus impetiginosus TaxID=429701 RepID=A0A2G9GNU6_9LAMI|nr:hypothetical protein CDL12_20556 [Handroanthus impetiginosus]